MSRHGYSDDQDDPLAIGRWQGAVKSALRGERGQAALRELLQALDAMPDKRLYPGSFATADGEFCALGVLGAHRGIETADLGDEDDCDPDHVGQRFNIASAMAAEVMYLNDEYLVDTTKWIEVEICGPMRRTAPDWGQHVKQVQVDIPDHPERRWRRMRAWVVENIKDPAPASAAAPALA